MYGSVTRVIPSPFLMLFFSVGAILTASAKNKGMFLGGRFLTGNPFFPSFDKRTQGTFFIVQGLGSACAATSAKSYIAELAPAHSRGAYLGFLNSL